MRNGFNRLFEDPRSLTTLAEQSYVVPLSGADYYS